MPQNSKVVWKEGMFLQPQHFQQAERHLIDLLDARVRALTPYFYGLEAIDIDADALANNLFTLTRCKGILPDGTPFDIPENDEPPPPRSFADHLTHETQSLDVHLALPVVLDARANVSAGTAEGVQAVRYKSRTVSLIDEVSGTQKKEIEIGLCRHLILFGDESLDDHATLHIARLVRSSSGQVVLQESFIPPLLYIGGSVHLMNMLRGLLELLLAKNASLASGRKEVEGGFAEFSAREETAFRLLQTLNAYTPLLNHHHVVSSVHPFDLFCLLSQLSGALCTFSSKVSIRDLPRYDHHNLVLTFERFSRVIRAVLEAEISAGSVLVPIEQIKPSTYAAKVPDPKLLTTAKFFFGVAAGVPEKELIVGVVRRIKICSREKLDLLISSAMPGVQLIHTSHPPEKLPTKPDFLYFALDQQGAMWNDIKASGVFGFYFPNNFPDLKMEIIALKQ